MTELATVTVCAGLETFGAVIAPGDVDNRPMPEPEELDFKVGAVFQAAMSLFAGSPLEVDSQSFLWGLVNAYHAQIKRLERAIDSNIQKQRALMASYDGSTVDDDTIIEETARGHALVEREEALTLIFDVAAREFQAATGSVWQPRYGSRAKAPHFPQSFLDASDFERERAKAHNEHNLPPGPYIVFAGGVDFQAVKTIWDRLDTALCHQPNMVLLHAGSRGACMIASKWAETRSITQIKYPLKKRHKDDRQAGFQRNERMLRSRPIGVIAFHRRCRSRWRQFRHPGIPRRLCRSGWQCIDRRRHRSAGRPDARGPVLGCQFHRCRSRHRHRHRGQSGRR